MATILMILTRINWPVYQKIFPTNLEVKIPCLTARITRPLLSDSYM